MSLSVIGAGFGRTGTMSLKHALEALGFGPCYHMTEVHGKPQHDRLWLDAVRGQAVDWDRLFRGYGSACDWPQCAFWRELMHYYPGSRVILTVRDESRWYESISGTIFEALACNAAPGDADAVLHRRMTRALIFERTFDERWRERDHVLEVYRAHVARVKAEVPPERLLVYEVSEGWSPLCEFLQVPVPDVAFPRVNSTQEFRSKIMGEPA